MSGEHGSTIQNSSQIRTRLLLILIASFLIFLSPTNDAKAGYREDYRLGFSAFNKKDYTGAIKYLSKFLEQTGSEKNKADHPRVYGTVFIHRARSYYSLGMHKEVIADSAKAISILPNEPSAHYLLGAGYLNIGEIEKAISSFNQTIALQDDYIHAYLDRGTAYSRKTMFEEAERDFVQVLQIQPRNLHANFNLGVLKAKQEDFQKSIQFLNVAISILPDFAPAFAARAHSNAALGNTVAAERDLKMARKFGYDR